jgi:superfamily II DNA or RNA helicase
MSTMSQETAFQPRKGQQDLIEYLPQIQRGDTLTVQWPTGYGKSIGFALAWKHCHENGIANRLLMVVANDTQRQQIVNDFAGDCRLVGAPCDGGVWSFERSAGDLRMARIGEVLVFVCTVQQLEASMARGGVNTLKDMLETAGSKWIVGFDEFHHYGEAMAWGDAAKLAMEHAQVSLAMSATPYRRGADTIFPEPKLCLSYREAEEGGCVKPMVCHSYEYAVAVIQDGEEVANYTTTELHRIAAGDLDQWEERKNIRYSPQYLHPLILHPIRRLREQRAKTGKRLQMLVRAMSCRHAKLVCEQIKIFADGLNVDWIGTGTSGRSDKENRNILAQFCPPKNKEGNRPEASIDVLVQVSMAGEGFDSVNVCEIIDLFPVSARALSGRATQDKQFYGRGARIIRGAESLPLSVNVPSDHPLHAWAGRSLGAWMDSCGSSNDTQPQEAPEPPAFDPWDFPELPKEREIELITVITDKQMYESFERSVCERRGYDKEKDRPEIMDLYLYAANQHAKEQSKQARAFQVREYLDAIVGRIALVRAKQTEEVSGAVIGRFKKETNAAIKRNFGRSREEMTEDELEVAAQWLLRQFQNMKGLPL